MNFKCSIPDDIRNEETIVLPISMSQPLERGERLKSIIQAFDTHGYKEQVTILVCDFLNRHNCKSEEEALKQGDEFIEKHQDILSGYRIIRWKDFLETIDIDIFQKKIEKIQEKSIEGSRFYNKMKKTWEKCLSADQSLENSIKYQIEEYAAILCMNVFDHLVYPKRITNGMAYLYNSFEGKKPEYHHIKISEFKQDQTDATNKDESFFIGKPISESSNSNHVHIAFRGLLEQMDVLLSSAELSEKSKLAFAEESENLFMKHSLLSNTEGF